MSSETQLNEALQLIKSWRLQYKDLQDRYTKILNIVIEEKDRGMMIKKIHEVYNR